MLASSAANSVPVGVVDPLSGGMVARRGFSLTTSLTMSLTMVATLLRSAVCACVANEGCVCARGSRRYYPLERKKVRMQNKVCMHISSHLLDSRSTLRMLGTRGLRCEQ